MATNELRLALLFLDNFMVKKIIASFIIGIICGSILLVPILYYFFSSTPPMIARFPLPAISIVTGWILLCLCDFKSSVGYMDNLTINQEASKIYVTVFFIIFYSIQSSCEFLTNFKF